MKELVGQCRVCGKDVYCRDGFLDGVVQENSFVLCFECDSNSRIKDEGNRKRL